jgi:hypothetical protein
MKKVGKREHLRSSQELDSGEVLRFDSLLTRLKSYKVLRNPTDG